MGVFGMLNQAHPLENTKIKSRVAHIFEHMRNKGMILHIGVEGTGAKAIRVGVDIRIISRSMAEWGRNRKICCLFFYMTTAICLVNIPCLLQIRLLEKCMTEEHDFKRCNS